MNLLDGYRYLVALEQHRHFGRAAAACHITQPALSNALRALETQLGVVVVRRGRQYEGLTPEGEQVLATAHRVLHEQALLQQALAGSDAQPQGRLLIGAVPTAMPLAARFAARLVERHAGLQPELRSLPSQEIESGLDTLAIDLGLGYTDRLAALPALKLQAWPQVDEQHLLLRRAEHPGSTLQVGGPLRWADAAALRLCMLSPDMHNRALLDAQFHRLGLRVRPVLQTNSVLALLAAVQGSSLAAVLPGALVKTVAHHGGLQAHALVEPELRTPIGFMTSAAATARPTRALQAALRLAQDPTWLADAARHSGALSSAD